MVQSNCSRIAGHKGHNRLHEMSAPTISPQTWKIYILKLTGEYYYVGISPDPEARFLKHTEGTGALWTRLHRPIQVLETIETNIPLKNFFGAERVETKIAVALMKTYGWRKVRGGKFTQTDDRFHLCHLCNCSLFTSEPEVALWLQPISGGRYILPKIFAVHRGFRRGIYSDWLGDKGAMKQVKDYPNALYRAFHKDDLPGAYRWLRIKAAPTNPRELAPIARHAILIGANASNGLKKWAGPGWQTIAKIFRGHAKS